MSSLGKMSLDWLGTTWATERTSAGPMSGALGFALLGIRCALNDQLRTGTDWGNLTV